MQKRKIPILIVALAMTVSLLTACGWGNGKNDDTVTTNHASQETTQIHSDTGEVRESEQNTVDGADSLETERIPGETVDGNTLDGVNVQDTDDRTRDGDGVVGDIVTDIATDIADDFDHSRTGETR